MFAAVRRSTVFAVLSFLSVASLAQAAPQRPLWPVPALSSFDGSKWGDLEIGVTTFNSIRDRYETGKGAYDHSTQLTQPKGAPVRVDCLWIKRGDDEVLSAITVRFIAQPPRVDEVEHIYSPDKEPIDDWYLEGRYEDWRVEQFPSKAVAAFSVRSGDVDIVPLLVLAPRDNFRVLPTRLTSDIAPVVNRIDPHQYQDKILDFGNISVKLDNDLDLPNSEEDRTKAKIRDAYAQGTLRYAYNGPGAYRVTMSGSEKHDGGSVTVTVSIEGDGPYAPISVTGTGSDTWKWRDKNDNTKDRDMDLVIGAYHDALRDARHDAEDSVAKAMLAQGPEPIASIREDQWATLVNAVRFTAPPQQNTVNDAILR